MTIIITHPGGAHLDDFLSCCLVMYKYKDIDEIRRKEPNKSEINHPNIWVLDVGDKYDPDLKCYDHHQIQGEDCTLSLLLKDWGFWEKANKFYPWLEVSVLRDVKGPWELCKFLEIRSSTIAKLDSFIERTILQFFEDEEVISSRHILFSLMKEFGKYFFTAIREYHKVLEKVEKKIEFKEIKDVLITICYKDMKHSSHIAHILKEKRKESYPDERGGIFVYPNKRVLGTIALERYKDDKRVDLQRLVDFPYTAVDFLARGATVKIKRNPELELNRWIQNIQFLGQYRRLFADETAHKKKEFCKSNEAWRKILSDFITTQYKSQPEVANALLGRLETELYKKGTHQNTPFGSKPALRKQSEDIIEKLVDNQVIFYTIIEGKAKRPVNIAIEWVVSHPEFKNVKIWGGHARNLFRDQKEINDLKSLLEMEM